VLILAIDTSTPCGSVAVLRDGKTIALVSSWTDEEYSSRIFRHVEMALEEAGASLEQFDLFAVTTGPGSFTGLRVGLAAVKGWAEVCGKPIAGVSALEAIALQSRAAEGVPLVPMLDARRREVYFTIYRRKRENGAMALEREGEIFVAAPNDFLDMVQSSLETRAAGDREFAIVTPAPEAIAGELRERNRIRGDEKQIALESVQAVLAPLVGEIAWRRAQAGELADALTLDADYVRRTDAELKWKDK
jgi:tRNA threonylcarbamoyladenosine biosynthesis protein TsaB